MLKKLGRHPGGTHDGILGNLVTTAEYAGASYLFGYNHYKNPKIFGLPVDLTAGVALKAISLGCGVFGFSRLCPHLDVVGNAGIGAYAHALGASHGAKSAGVSRLVLPKGADASKVKALIPGAEVLGAISPAPKGDLLSADDLARLARR